MAVNALLPIGDPPEMKRYTGAQRAAALLLALGKERSAPVWSQLTQDEIMELSAAIANLGRVPANVVEHVLLRFASELSSISSLHGSFESAERLLDGLLPAEQIAAIMEDIRGPSGRTMWDKLSNVSESVLAGYLRHEHPQTIAVIFHKLKSDHAARILAELPPELSVDVVLRMLRTDTVQKEVIQEVEETLRHEFMNNLSRAQRRDPHEAIAEVFNALDRQTEEQLLGALETKAPDAAERIRALMFTFEDLAKLLPASIQVLVRNADKRDMALALKGAPEEIKMVFFNGMTERAGKLLREDIAGMGPVRARECEEAQTRLVRLAKALTDRGEIVLVDPKAEESIIY
ncbi:MAG: hypothetical protein RIS17_1500 [Pseudomonadota bacterium]